MAKKKTTRLERSQAAHVRLINKHRQRMKDRDDAWIPQQYHVLVWSKQNQEHRVLNRVEKERLYERARYYFYN